MVKIACDRLYARGNVITYFEVIALWKEVVYVIICKCPQRIIEVQEIKSIVLGEWDLNFN